MEKNAHGDNSAWMECESVNGERAVKKKMKTWASMARKAVESPTGAVEETTMNR